MSYHSNADLGGQDVRGAVLPEPEGEWFHADWERRVFAMTLAMNATGLWNIDMNRAARETLVDYRDISYYEIWFKALTKLLASSGAMHKPVPPSMPVLRADEVAATLARGSPYQRLATHAARFAVGQAVRAQATAPSHHTRLPGYVRGKIGLVERAHGVHVYADANAAGLGESPQWLYTVTFSEQELWGEQIAAQGAVISVDAWESYLQPA